MLRVLVVVGWGAQPLGGTATTCNGDSDCGAAGDCETFPEAIVIGVANDANRVYEYTPTVDPTETSLGPAGGADQYIQMLVTELKPQIDSMLRTRPDVDSTLMAGSSLGGLVTAYAGLKRPDVYGRIAAISPSTWWDSDVIVDRREGHAAPRPTARSSSTSTRARARSTTRRTPTSWRRPTWRSATSTA